MSMRDRVASAASSQAVLERAAIVLLAALAVAVVALLAVCTTRPGNLAGAVTVNGQRLASVDAVLTSVSAPASVPWPCAPGRPGTDDGTRWLRH